LIGPRNRFSFCESGGKSSCKHGAAQTWYATNSFKVYSFHHDFGQLLDST
jgi:hypothetical protein